MDTNRTLGDEIRRRPVPVKLLPSGITSLDTTAHAHSRPGKRMSRGDVLRACMVVAYRHEAELNKVLTEMSGGEL